MVLGQLPSFAKKDSLSPTMSNLAKRVLILAVAFLGDLSIAQVAPLPLPSSNNAVVSVKTGKHEGFYSFMGIGAKKNWDSITNRAFVLDLRTWKWSELHPVPGPAGRIGASAISARGQILLLGGYTVDGRSGETTVTDVSVYEPELHRWYRGTDLPVAVHDAVVGLYRDSLSLRHRRRGAEGRRFQCAGVRHRQG